MKHYGNFQEVKTYYKKRTEKRQVWICLTPELKKEYIDEDGNIQIKGFLLEDVTQKPDPEAPSLPPNSQQTFAEIFENFAEGNKKRSPKHIGNMIEKFVIDKFTRKTFCGMGSVGNRKR